MVSTVENTIAMSQCSSDIAECDSVKSHDSNSKRDGFLKIPKEIFRYRKTTLSFLTFIAVLLSISLNYLNTNLDISVQLPSNQLEASILESAWNSLEVIGFADHPYSSHSNDKLRDYLEDTIKKIIHGKDYIEFDNDMNCTNNIMFMQNYLKNKAVSYYESNNLLVRVHGTDKSLPSILVSAHFDSVPGSYGITDDGIGVASILGLLSYYSNETVSRPKRTIIFNINNNEEFGLSGATALVYHPWFKQINYFLNLEGVGAGGKAILFRCTDYGIAKFFKNVRYPFGTSIFQQGFNSKLLPSETDYKVYKENGSLRGLDLAFYRPRGFYHTKRDNINSVDKKSVWHMLSTSLDFVNTISSAKIDLDDEGKGGSTNNLEAAMYGSFLNKFFVVPLSSILLLNILMLFLVPLISLPFFFIDTNRKTWSLGFFNFMKYPFSLILSVQMLKAFVSAVVVPANEFLPNSSSISLVWLLISFFLISNYFILNGLNYLFGQYKGVNHDEKLIVLIQNSAVFWCLLLYSTIRLCNKTEDHSGEYVISLLFMLQSVGSFYGLIGWLFKGSKHKKKRPQEVEAQSLLGGASFNSYGNNSSIMVEENYETDTDIFQGTTIQEIKAEKKINKYFSYDWSIQFLIVVPLSLSLIYTSGSLILEGLDKTLLESKIAERFIYITIEVFAIAYSLPLLPFIFKFNRFNALLLISIFTFFVFNLFLMKPFDEQHPFKLRFLQIADLKSSNTSSTVTLYGRESPVVKEAIQYSFWADPNESESREVSCNPMPDGTQTCFYNVTTFPSSEKSNITGFNDMLQVSVIKSSNSKYPFGLLSGVVEINALDSRVCHIEFLDTISSHRKPVKSVTVYNKNYISEQKVDESSTEGFSRDANGNYVYKDFGGIDRLYLRKLSWDSPMRVGFSWMPDITEASDSASRQSKLTLSMKVDCFWDELPYSGKKSPVYESLLFGIPNWFIISNNGEGLFDVSTTIEV